MDLLSQFRYRFFGERPTLEVPPPSPTKRFFILGSIFILSALLIVFFFFVRAPRKFVPGTVISIKKGVTLEVAAETTHVSNIVRSPKLLQVALLLHSSKGKVIAGDYIFDTSPSVFAVARRLYKGDFGDVRRRVVLYEGMTIVEMAKILDKQFRNFDTDQFMALVGKKEGYVYPDTYFFFPSVTTYDIVATIENSFNEAIASVQDQIDKSGHSLEEILIMASIIEREASGKGDREMIAGILWKRIEKGIPLQVDAPFVYSIGKGSASLTTKDLKTNSPYNTYLNKGLPPTPIGNPGILAIKAALNPEDSPYLFFLHDRRGGVHYAVTFDQHKANKRLYLR